MVYSFCVSIITVTNPSNSGTGSLRDVITKTQNINPSRHQR
ncbi:hypothetical protein [Cylindrospermum sp. FACHB-282]|nr:hypothetical protein [Cylindrospermum sp. FACHB-282]